MTTLQSASTSRLAATTADESIVRIMGIPITNCSSRDAIDTMEGLIKARSGRTHAFYIINAHTINLAAESERYHRILQGGYRVYGDGTGVRWAARMRGTRMRENLVGTDLMPALFKTTADRGYSYYLLGANAATIERAAEYCRTAFPGWKLAGHRNGYMTPEELPGVIEGINAARPDVLLVGMGNPIQETWIHDNRDRLQVPVAVGVGGLFDHWGGNLTRAPGWVRAQGLEWLQIMLQQPHKSRRYLLGNPMFLYRVGRTARAERVPPGTGA